MFILPVCFLGKPTAAMFWFESWLGSSETNLAGMATHVGGHWIKLNIKSAPDVVGNVITMGAPYKGKDWPLTFQNGRLLVGTVVLSPSI